MSRSKRKPIVKDGPRNYKKSSAYWRTVRRVTKEKVKYLNEELEDNILPDPQEIVNDYDYSDYRFDFRFRDDEISEKESRK
jgi:hypothetical protein